MSWSADFSLDLGIQGCCTLLHRPVEGRRGQAGRLWAGKLEYLSARLLPSVVLNISKNPEIPFLLLCLRNLLALLVTPSMLVGSRRPRECLEPHGLGREMPPAVIERRKDGVGNVAVGALESRCQPLFRNHSICQN